MGNRFALAQSMLVIGLAAALGWSVLALRRAESSQVALSQLASPRVPVVRIEPVGEEKARVELYRAASPSVVNITTHATIRARRTSQSAQSNGSVRQIAKGSGTGLVWDRSGRIVTNFHLFQDADGATITLADGSSYSATPVGFYADKDIAVLRIDAPPATLVPITLGTSSDLDVGQTVLAIGHPFGLEQTLTVGVISGLGREITSINGRPIQDVIQTDAAINPGNSGGPLFDSSGRVIGLNTQILSNSGDCAGIGFAVPIDEVNRIVPQLIRTGKVTKPVLGITPWPAAMARRYGISGVVVRRVHQNNPAAQAGILGTHRDNNGAWALGDIITAIDGIEVQEANDIYRILDRKKMGDSITVDIIRKHDKLQLILKLS